MFNFNRVIIVQTFNYFLQLDYNISIKFKKDAHTN